MFVSLLVATPSRVRRRRAVRKGVHSWTLRMILSMYITRTKPAVDGRRLGYHTLQIQNIRKNSLHRCGAIIRHALGVSPADKKNVIPAPYYRLLLRPSGHRSIPPYLFEECSPAGRTCLSHEGLFRSSFPRFPHPHQTLCHHGYASGESNDGSLPNVRKGYTRLIYTEGESGAVTHFRVRFLQPPSNFSSFDFPQTLAGSGQE